MDRVINEVDSIAVLRKEVKTFVNAAVKSKFFEKDGVISVFAVLETFADKNEPDFYSVAVQGNNAAFEYCVQIPKKVSKKVDETMFDKLKEIYAKRTKPITINVSFDKTGY